MAPHGSAPDSVPPWGGIGLSQHPVHCCQDCRSYQSSGSPAPRSIDTCSKPFSGINSCSFPYSLLVLPNYRDSDIDLGRLYRFSLEPHNSSGFLGVAMLSIFHSDAFVGLVTFTIGLTYMAMARRCHPPILSVSLLALIAGPMVDWKFGLFLIIGSLGLYCINGLFEHSTKNIAFFNRLLKEVQ